ncbi:MAG: FkbM family methyltransferase [Gammaproteobacteria bacterium]|nr:FkbM family methyltransferase [Gammaproteobacteria bacterium]
MSVQRDLVYDVGMHNGNDTAYYLHRGFRVVAIEANPELIAPARARFAAEIARGQLCIENVAIAAAPGEVELHVSSRFDMLASVDAEHAAMLGGDVRTIKVPGIPLGFLFEKHGVPHYLKVDIEGADRFCLDAIEDRAAPDFVSIEMDHAAGDSDIRRLAAFGYRRFHCVRQNDLQTLGPANLEPELAARRKRSREPLNMAAYRLRQRARRLLAPARLGDWRFPRGSSGPFGADLPPEWMTVEQMLAVWQSLHDIDLELASGGVGEWFDIHAGR